MSRLAPAVLMTALLASGCGPESSPPRAQGEEASTTEPQIRDLKQQHQAHFNLRVAQFEEENARLDPARPHVILLGDSLTETFPEAETLFTGRVVLNRGVSGDAIKPSVFNPPGVGILNRLEESLPPVPIEAVYLLIGTNAVLLPEFSEDDFREEYRGLLEEIRGRAPGSKVVLFSVPPVAEFVPNSATVSDRIRHLNEWIRDEGVRPKGRAFLDLWALLSDERGFLRPEFTAYNGIHLTPEAYEEWGKVIALSPLPPGREPPHPSATNVHESRQP